MRIGAGQQDIDDIVILVYGRPQIVAPASDCDDHSLIETPSITELRLHSLLGTKVYRTTNY